ncbi:peptidogalycan biosysnthesis protein [Sphingomonas sp. MMS24-JH45]
MVRQGTQFHWMNRGYASFDDFLAALSSRKRKAIRKERAAAVEGLTIRHLTGTAIGAREWEAFWAFSAGYGQPEMGAALSEARVLPVAGGALDQAAADPGRSTTGCRSRGR